MAGRYIPPSLRKAAPANSPAETQAPGGTNEGLQIAANNEPDAPRRSLKDLETAHSNRLPKTSAEEVHTHYNPDGYSDRSTLNDSSATPGQLAYVVLFPGANPRWVADRIIFVKSNLNCLTPPVLPQPESVTSDKDASDLLNSTPSTVTYQTPTTQLALPVFNVNTRGPLNVRNVNFVGWFRIKRMQHLAKGSSELIRMLEQKWATPDKTDAIRHQERAGHLWQESLSYDWAVCQFEECKEDLAAPAIDTLLHKRRKSSGAGTTNARGLVNTGAVWRGKSVNEDVDIDAGREEHLKEQQNDVPGSTYTTLGSEGADVAQEKEAGATMAHHHMGLDE